MSDVDHSKMKLGLGALCGLPMLSKYKLDVLTWPTAHDLVAPAGTCAMHLNDTIGCCTVAALANAIARAVWLGSGNVIEIDDGEVLAAYCQLSGYKVGDESTDVGCDVRTVVDFAVSTGLAGHKALAAYDVTDLVLPSVYFVGGCYLAVALPKRAQTQDVWDLPPGMPATGDDAPGSWNDDLSARHLVYVVGYDEDGVILETWGEGRKRATHRWVAEYMVQAIAILFAESIRPDGKSAEGFDLDALLADASQLAATS